MEMPEVDVPEVDVDELEVALIQGGVLIDVREAEEFEVARVPGARLIPLAEVADRRGEIPNGSRVSVICAKGGLRGASGRTGPTPSTSLEARQPGSRRGRPATLGVRSEFGPGHRVPPGRHPGAFRDPLGGDR